MYTSITSNTQENMLEYEDYNPQTDIDLRGYFNKNDVPGEIERHVVIDK